jgi:uncharacterized protein
VSPAHCTQQAVRGIGLLADRLLPRLRTHACLVLAGPREVGKTTLGNAIAAASGLSPLVYDASLEVHRGILLGSNSPLARSAGRIIVIEEYERIAEALDIIRHEINRNGIDRSMLGRFILVTGRKPTQRCLASDLLGTNVVRCVVEPMSLTDFISLATVNAEITDHALATVPPIEPLVELPKTPDLVQQHWLRGGFLKSLHATSNLDSMNWRVAYLENFLASAIPDTQPPFGPTEMRERLSRINLKSSNNTNFDKRDRVLLDYLSDILLLRKLRAWDKNALKALETRPRYYIRDSGLLHAWLRVHNVSDLEDADLKGASWEGYCIEQILSCRPVPTASYFRQDDKYEVDLVLPLSAERTIVCEFGYGKDAPNAGNLMAMRSVGAQELYVINNGNEKRQTAAYTALPLAEFLRCLQQW